MPAMTVVGLAAFSGAFATTLYHLCRPGKNPWWANRVTFVLLLTAALGIFQREAIQANFQLWNPDESQMIAGALTLQQRPVFWRDSDGGSHGPLDQWPLVLPALFGARIDYTSARIMAAMLTVFLLVGLQAALAGYLKDGTARLLVLPAWAFYIFNQHPEAAQYTSELMPSLLIAIAVALRPKASNSAWWCALVGFAAGAAPFAKLQIAPLTAWVLLFTAITLWREPARWRLLAGLTMGAIFPALIFIGQVTVCGAFADFRIRYIESNLFGYAIDGNQFFVDEYPSIRGFFGFGQFFWPLTGAVLIGSCLLFGKRHRSIKSDLLLALGLFATALFAVYFPKKPFVHYFLLLVVPLVLLVGATAGPAWEAISCRLSALRRTVLGGALGLGLCGFTNVNHLQHPDALRYIARWRPAISRPLVEALQQRTVPGDTLAVWGWQPALYVMTQTVAATPEHVVFWQIEPSRWQDYYRTSYMQNLLRHPPAVFVDTTGPADFFFANNHATTRFEIFPRPQRLHRRALHPRCHRGWRPHLPAWSFGIPSARLHPLIGVAVTSSLRSSPPRPRADSPNRSSGR